MLRVNLVSCIDQESATAIDAQPVKRKKLRNKIQWKMKIETAITNNNNNKNKNKNKSRMNVHAEEGKQLGADVAAARGMEPYY